MTGNFLIDTLISLAGIVMMVAAARLVFPAPKFAITELMASERMAFDEPDFTPLHWLMDKQGRAALAEGAGGEFILAQRLGLDLVLRRFSAGAAEAIEEDGALVVKLPDLTVPKAVIANGDASKWVRKLSGVGGG